MLRWSTDGGAPWRMSGLSAVVLLTLSACGSTVQWSDTIAEGGPGEIATDDELSLAGPGAAEAQAGAGPGTAEAQAGAGPGTAEAQAGAGPGTAEAQAGETGRPQPGASGRGYTAKEIFIGFGTLKQLEEGLKAAGANADFGDQEGNAEAMAKEINQRGGLAGRRVVLVFHDVSLQDSSRNQDAAAQVACTRWTEDRPVFAVINPVAFGDRALAACLAQRQTILVGMENSFSRPQSMYSRHAPYLYAPASLSVERLVPIWMQRAAANGYFKGGWDSNPASPGREPTKIGILSRKNLHGAEFSHVVRREMARQSQTVAATAEFSGDFSRASDEMNSAAIRFSQSGVTHVISDGGGQLNYFFQAAESQQYRPRYALSTLHAPNSLLLLAPREQLTGALGIGYLPVRDLDNARDPGDVSAARTRCRKIMKDAGMATSNRSAFIHMVTTCDGFNFLAAAIEKGDLSAAGVRRGTQSMKSMPSASSFRISFPQGRFDGAAAVRDLAWNMNCDNGDGCFEYTSGNHGA